MISRYNPNSKSSAQLKQNIIFLQNYTALEKRLLSIRKRNISEKEKILISMRERSKYYRLDADYREGQKAYARKRYPFIKDKLNTARRNAYPFVKDKLNAARRKAYRSKIKRERQTEVL